jgi:hypothetical protein
MSDCVELRIAFLFRHLGTGNGSGLAVDPSASVAAASSMA